MALLDLHLGDGDGLALLRRWRQAGRRQPVIVLTARNQVSGRVRGLQAGADDDLVKPFDLDELLARVDAVARRTGPATATATVPTMAAAAATATTAPPLATGALRLDALAQIDTAEQLASLGAREEFVVYQVRGTDGQLVLHSHDAPDAPLDPDQRNGLRRAGPWLVLTLNAADGSRRAQVAETVAHRAEVLWASLSWLAGTLLALLPLAAVGLGWVLRRAFASLEPIRQELARRPTGRHRRPAPLFLSAQARRRGSACVHHAVDHAELRTLCLLGELPCPDTLPACP